MNFTFSVLILNFIYLNQLVFGRRVQIEFNRFTQMRHTATSTMSKEFKDLEREKTRRDNSQMAENSSRNSQQQR